MARASRWLEARAGGVTAITPRATVAAPSHLVRLVISRFSFFSRDSREARECRHSLYGRHYGNGLTRQPQSLVGSPTARGSPRRAPRPSPEGTRGVGGSA